MLVLLLRLILVTFNVFSLQSAPGFEVQVTESGCAKQTVDLEISYQPPDSSYLEPNEILLSPFVMVTNMVEEETEIQLTFPFLSNLPDDADTMAKWIRFYGSLSDYAPPVWRDIRRIEDLESFMVEIFDDHVRLYTQENITFCMVGSREPEEEYDYGSGMRTSPLVPSLFSRYRY